MEDKIKKDLEDILHFNSDSDTEIEEFRVKYLGKKGLLNSYFVEFKSFCNKYKELDTYIGFDLLDVYNILCINDETLFVILTCPFEISLIIIS